MSALTPGTRIGPYEVLAALGAGGMGEVYRARDTRLERTVAIKVLSSALADDPQARERLEREARAISSLTHPHICVLYDIGRERPTGPAGGEAPDAAPASLDFLVMEYLEGETLAARMARQPLSLDEALGLAIQIASALDTAHGQGIVHRDLKPGNVMLTRSARAAAPSGGSAASLAHVKLLDFGLARLTGPSLPLPASGDGARGLVSLADLSMPTVSSPLTLKGTILGTLQYMSPEQLEGRDADARADIFAFGALLYEMATGRRPFEGRSQASLIGAILDHTPPPIASIVPGAPPLFDDLVARCLAKDPDDRWQSARDLTRQLEWIAAHPAPAAGAEAIPGTSVGRSGRGTQLLRLVAALGVVGTIAGTVAAWRLWPTAAPPPVVSRFTIELPADQMLTRTGRRVVALSPDGSRFAYVANQQIYVRPLNELTAIPVPGTAGTDPNEPVFSPDGQWLAFWSGGQIRKVPVAGGLPLSLSEAENPTGMTWEGHRLLVGQGREGIIAIPENGGAPQTLVAGGGGLAQSPQLLAGGTAVLYTRSNDENQLWDKADIVVEVLATGARTVLVTGGTHGRVLPTGHLVYARENSLFALAFDEKTLSVSGAAVPVLQGIELATGNFSGAAQVAWSDTGTFLSVGATGLGDRALMWMDRQGRLERSSAPVRRYQGGSSHLSVSPDGTRAAMTVETRGDRSGTDVWVWDIARGALAKLSQVEDAESPVWTADSRRVCYKTAAQVFCQAADGAGQAEPLFTLESLVSLGWLLPEGRGVLLQTRGAPYSDISLADLSPTPNVRPVIQTSGSDTEPILSRDGRWLAYSSNQSGNFEVYVQPFPDVGRGRWQISTGGGVAPRWSRDGRELYFLDVAGSQGSSAPRGIMAAAMGSGPAPTPDKPVTLAPLPPLVGRNYDVAPDGRFLISVPAAVSEGGSGPRQHMVLVHNWFEEIRARVPKAP